MITCGSHPAAQRHFRRHRPDRLRQDDHALFLPAPHQHHRFQTAHGRRPGGIRHRRHHAGGRQRGRRHDLQQGLARLPAPGPGHHHGGEMRDLETSQIAIQASLTGHLVLSTLHTNDAPGAVTRLDRHGRGTVLDFLDLDGRAGATAGAHHLQEMPHPFEPTETSCRCSTFPRTTWATRCSITDAAAPTATTPATRAGAAFSSCWSPREADPPAHQRAGAHGRHPPESRGTGHGHLARRRLARNFRR
jgi:hypothetical protein